MGRNEFERIHEESFTTITYDKEIDNKPPSEQKQTDTTSLINCCDRNTTLKTSERLYLASKQVNLLRIMPIIVMDYIIVVNYRLMYYIIV